MPPDTRHLILDAAERLFAAQGFPRTTIKQIGQAAGVNSALLYYYFGDKDRLYRSAAAVRPRLVRP
jgi:AcrR family transcriptional regulator